jgi:hypothetical protein
MNWINQVSAKSLFTEPIMAKHKYSAAWSSGRDVSGFGQAITP